MFDHHCQFSLAVALFLAAAPPAPAQERPAEQDRPLGAIIILENNRLRIEEPRGLETELLPSSQFLRTVHIESTVRELVRQLDDAAFATREAATRKLIDLRIDDTQMFAVLERGDLSSEQLNRLLHIVRERLINTPRGALGIRMDAGRPAARVVPDQENAEQQAPEGVTILEIISGMPAEGVLRVGDRITHINQVPLTSSDDLIDLVQTRRPGDSILLTIQRPQHNNAGQGAQPAQHAAPEVKMELEITLGAVDDLHDPRIPTAPTRLEIERRRMVAAVLQRYSLQPRVIEILRPE